MINVLTINISQKRQLDYFHIERFATFLIEFQKVLISNISFIQIKFQAFRFVLSYHTILISYQLLMKQNRISYSDIFYPIFMGNFSTEYQGDSIISKFLTSF